MPQLRKHLLLVAVLLFCLAIATAALLSVSSSARTGSLGDRTSAIEPFVLESGNGLYLLSFSGEINGEFQGDLRISLEGTPAMDYRLVNLAPIRFFGRNQGQGLKKHILHGLNRGDKLAILVVMQPQLVKVEGFEVPIASCCAPPRTRSSGSPDLSEPIQSPLTLSLIAAASGKPLLQIPILFH